MKQNEKDRETFVNVLRHKQRRLISALADNASQETTSPAIVKLLSRADNIPNVAVHIEESEILPPLPEPGTDAQVRNRIYWQRAQSKKILMQQKTDVLINQLEYENGLLKQYSKTLNADSSTM